VLYFGKKPLMAALGMLLDSSTILLIITENKLPLGINYPTFRRKYLWNKFAVLFVTISIYHHNKKKKTKWNSK
jgi:SSS family solute:Na+ symporter